MTLEELAERVHEVKNILWWREQMLLHTETSFILADALGALEACAAALDAAGAEELDESE
jgi:hypothetical protein